ncbi:S-adenosylmethionine tRNA ribosyltransferase [Peptococcaceae bacterium SCADC1_2_3]|nr:S-adenosylmethionine tRNA ribosyltransferase [Peptococcaceae bacterium SCADC1_2_3]
MDINEFNYYLPPELIAQEPLPQRDKSRLMVLDRQMNRLEHKYFPDLINYLTPGNVLVFNETKVIPARLYGRKVNGGARVEVLLTKEQRGGLRWEALVRPARRVKVGSLLTFGNGLLTGKVVEETAAGGRIIEFQNKDTFKDSLEKIGLMPLPPYIKKYPADPTRYQTVYARLEGSVAAPTAGLHFTPELLTQIKEKGGQVVFVLLHVGLGTFQPVRKKIVSCHQMHSEYFSVGADAAEVINKGRRQGKRIIAVGTTTVRCLETMALESGEVKSGAGWTDLFIYPGYRFKAIDGLVTNFHLPRSTLLLMVSALAGREKIHQAYQEAIKQRYRFYSFGDAMLIL